MISESWEHEFANWYLDQTEHWQDAISYILPTLRLVVDQQTSELANIDGRVKGFRSARDKFSDKYLDEASAADDLKHPQEYVTDFVGFRVVCYFDDDVIKLVDAIRQSFRVVDETDKISEMELESSNFGYRAHHLNASLKVGHVDNAIFERFGLLTFEIQVRTVVQDSWSRLSHKLVYKKEVPLEVSRGMTRLAAMFEQAERSYIDLREAMRVAVIAPIEEAVTLNTIEQIVTGVTQIQTLDSLSMKKLFVDYEQAKGSFDPTTFERELRRGWGVVQNAHRLRNNIRGDLSLLRSAIYLSNRSAFRNMLSLRNRQLVDTIIPD